MSDLEKRLRDSLAAHARLVPDRDELAERIVASTDGTVVPIIRRWSTWTLPLVAAAAVAVVAGVLVGVTQFHHSATPPAATHSATPTQQAPTSPAPSTPAQPSSSAATQAAGLGLTHFQAIDLTFVGTEDGWALGTATCLNDPSKACAAMAYTRDGGSTWHSMKQPPGATVPMLTCTDACITDVRFATDTIGYAFGPSALYMTTDGGSSWRRQSGGAVALETLDGNVIRVATMCVPGCPYQVQTAPIGSAAWQNRATIEGGMSPTAILQRVGSSAYLAVLGHTAGGAQNATTAMWVSTDDGTTWTNRGEPCPQNLPGYGEVDTTRVASAADGSVTVLCTPRTQGKGSQFTMTSTDGGRTFRRGGLGELNTTPPTELAAASAQVIVVATGDGVYRSTDGGSTFSKLSGNDVPSGRNVTFAGFESGTVGRIADDGGRIIWTTHDAGATWRSVAFG